MNNLEQAVIDAARVMAEEGVNDHWTACAVVVALEALEAAEPKRRKFWINFHLNGIQGSGEGGINTSTTGPVTLETLRVWSAGISAANSNASIVIRTWTELEA